MKLGTGKVDIDYQIAGYEECIRCLSIRRMELFWFIAMFPEPHAPLLGSSCFIVCYNLSRTLVETNQDRQCPSGLCDLDCRPGKPQACVLIALCSLRCDSLREAGQVRSGQVSSGQVRSDLQRNISGASPSCCRQCLLATTCKQVEPSIIITTRQAHLVMPKGEMGMSITGQVAYDVIVLYLCNLGACNYCNYTDRTRRRHGLSKLHTHTHTVRWQKIALLALIRWGHALASRTTVLRRWILNHHDP